jgi:hypothetical protein
LFDWKLPLMRNAAGRSAPVALLLIAILCGCGPVHAQSGSAGGSIGNEEKSLSGSREAPHEKAAAAAISTARGSSAPAA